MLRVSCGADGANQAPSLLIHYGPEVIVNIGLDPGWRRTSGSPPKLPISPLKALVDTGARECYIDLALATELALPHVDRRPGTSVFGTREVDYFRAQIYVPTLKLAIGGPFGALPLIASKLNFSALLGRSFLQYVCVEWNGITGACDIIRP
jgi:hypothetical protein